MSEKPLVSIAVITYNSAKFILETLESAKAQSYEKIELIISDDGSQDDTIKLCKSWLEENKARFVRVKLVTVSKNTGIPANMNRAVKTSNGNWIKPIAGDDVLTQNCIAENISFVKNNNQVEVLFSKIGKYKDSFSQDNFISCNPNLEAITFKKFFSNDANFQYRHFIKHSSFFGITPTCFIRKSVIQCVGGYDESFRVIEDLPMWIRLTKNNIKLYFFNSITVKYRVHSGNISNSGVKKAVKKSYFIIEGVRKRYIYDEIGWFKYLKFKTLYILSLLWFQAKILNSTDFGVKIYKKSKSILIN